jgi:hypothetical protein
MQYMMLIYTTPASMGDGLSEAEVQALTAEYFAIRDEPGFLAGDQLQPVETATTVRIQNSETLITDGPFADTKEAFAGYYLFELDDLDRALEIAAKIPAARLGGSVEVRALVGK